MAELFWDAMENPDLELGPYVKEVMQAQRRPFKLSPLQVLLLEQAQALKSHLRNCRKRKEKQVKFWDCLEPSGLEDGLKPDGGTHDGGPTAGDEKGEGHEGTPNVACGGEEPGHCKGDNGVADGGNQVVLKGGPVSWRALCGGGPSAEDDKADEPGGGTSVSADKADEPADASLQSGGLELVASLAAEPAGMKQPKIARFFKKPSELKPEDMEPATVQKVGSRHVPVTQQVESALLADTLVAYEEHRLARKRSFGDDGGGCRSSGWEACSVPACRSWSFE